MLVEDVSSFHWSRAEINELYVDSWVEEEQAGLAQMLRESGDNIVGGLNRVGYQGNWDRGGTFTLGLLKDREPGINMYRVGR